MSNTPSSSPTNPEGEPAKPTPVHLSVAEAKTTSPEAGKVYLVGPFDEFPDIYVSAQLDDSGDTLHFYLYRAVDGEQFLQPVENGWFWSPFNFNRPARDLTTGEDVSLGFEGTALPVPHIINQIKYRFSDEFEA